MYTSSDVWAKGHLTTMVAPQIKFYSVSECGVAHHEGALTGPRQEQDRRGNSVLRDHR
jgi:hypothetical protein